MDVRVEVACTPSEIRELETRLGLEVKESMEFLNYIGFEFLTALLMKVLIFLDLAPSSPYANR
jgi:hypothetical protein